MTKKFFESFKRRFGEVTMIYFCDPLKDQYTNRWHHYLDLESDRIYVENVEWEKDVMTITYTELIPYIDWNCGSYKYHKERRVKHVKRTNIHTVWFRHFNP